MQVFQLPKALAYPLFYKLVAPNSSTVTRDAILSWFNDKNVVQVRMMMCFLDCIAFSCYCQGAGFGLLPEVAYVQSQGALPLHALCLDSNAQYTRSNSNLHTLNSSRIHCKKLPATIKAV